MKKAYKVAGHGFSLEMPDQHPFWETMQSYEPFLVGNDTACRFEMVLLATLPNIGSRCFVRVDDGESNDSRFELSELNGEWLFAMTHFHQDTPAAYLFTDKEFSRGRLFVNDNAAFVMHSMMMLMYALATARHGTLMMHSSVTMCDGKGYLFLGRSGTGKSTHSQLWINNLEGCELLNDDNPVLRIGDDGVTRVYGTPWSGKTPCYRNVEVPVGAVVGLRQAKQNKIQRLPLPQAYALLFSSFSGYHALRELADGYHATSEHIVTTVPFYQLDCLPDADAAVLCHKTVTR